MKSEKGVTLIIAIMTVLLLMILVGLLVTNGMQTFKDSKVIKFQSYMKIIQKEVDVGLLNYIKLSEMPEKWAEKILSYIDSNHEIDDSKIQENLNKFSSNEICEQYAKIYGG